MTSKDDTYPYHTVYVRMYASRKDTKVYLTV